jgi:hypothetical protein
VPHPGIYQIDLPDLTVENAEGQTTGHLLVTSRNTVQAVSPWERRFSQALIGGQPKPDKLVFHVEKPNVQYIYLEYAGSGALALGPMQATFVPMPMRRQSELVHRFVAGEDTQGEDGIILGASYPKLPPGHYRARYRIEGSTFSTFFQRLPPPLVMAVYAGPADPTQLENLARAWFLQERISFTTSGVPSYTRPLAEQIVPPWWASIPLASETAFDLPFHLTSAEDVWFLLRYQGEEDLAVREVVLYRDHYEGF